MSIFSRFSSWFRSKPKTTFTATHGKRDVLVSAMREVEGITGVKCKARSVHLQLTAADSKVDGKWVVHVGSVRARGITRTYTGNRFDIVIACPAATMQIPNRAVLLEECGHVLAQGMGITNADAQHAWLRRFGLEAR